MCCQEKALQYKQLITIFTIKSCSLCHCQTGIDAQVEGLTRNATRRLHNRYKTVTKPLQIRLHSMNLVKLLKNNHHDLSFPHQRMRYQTNEVDMEQRLKRWLVCKG